MITPSPLRRLITRLKSRRGLKADPIWRAADIAEREARRRHQSIRVYQQIKAERVRQGLTWAAGR